MATIMTLMAKLALDNSSFRKGLGEAETDVADIGDTASGASGILSGLGGTGAIAMSTVAIAAAAVVAAVVAVGVALGVVVAKLAELTLAAAKFEATRLTFGNLTKAIGGSAAVTEQLRDATRGMVSDTDLWFASNKFLLMGLTETADETAAMAEMAVQLGVAMGGDATEAMENWALMMANQSIPRLDSFGISSGVARVKMEEMMAANENMTREMAFSSVVMEMGAAKMALVGDISETTTGSMARWEAGLSNLRTGIGQGFIPVLDVLLGAGQPVVDLFGEKLPAMAAKAGDWLANKLTPVVRGFGRMWGQLWPGAKAVVLDFWDMIQPVFQKLEVYCDAYTKTILPHLRTAWETLRKGWLELVDVWFDDLRPAFEELWKSLEIGDEDFTSIGESVGGFFGMLAELMASELMKMLITDLKAFADVIIFTGKWLTWVKDTVELVVDIFWAFMEVIDNVNLALQGMYVPDWMLASSGLPGLQAAAINTGAISGGGVSSFGGDGGGTSSFGSTAEAAGSTRGGDTYILTANYPMQEEGSLIQDVRLLQMLATG